VRLDLVRVRARHDEVDVVERVAQPRASGDVGQRCLAPLAALEVVEVHQVRAGAEDRLVAAQGEGRLSAAVVEDEGRRRRFAGARDQARQQVHPSVPVQTATGGEQQLAALVVAHAHADIGQNL